MTASVQLKQVSLRVAELSRAIDFYSGQLGFVVGDRSATDATLATGSGAAPILRLTEDRKAVRPPRDAAGLFHAALLFPNRAALGAWLRSAAQRGVDFDGFSDHGVSEAIYFSDPEGNGLEFYADRARAEWPIVGDQVQMVTNPLDLESLVRAGAATTGLPLTGTTWGHLHLRVTDLDRSEQFYREALGLAVTQRDFPGARFMAADGYHHHLGLNRWGGVRQPQPAEAFGLIEATFARRSATATETLRDPDHLSIQVTPP